MLPREVFHAKPLNFLEIMDAIGINLQAVKRRIAKAAAQCGRNPDDIGLIAVSKTFGAEAVATAYAQGQRAFGESYVQEAVEKIPLFSHLELEWHFIGPIQSNKTRAIALNFTWVHSVDRLKIAERLSSARPASLPPLQICLQVNIGNESTKNGVAPAETLTLARAVAALPNLRLRGLMAIPPATQDTALQRHYFSQLRLLKDELTASGIALATLSMGMSDDLEAAITEGATLVRIGTAIFGPRPLPG
jgi:pyridoxal phosphate enzyme (YggS family)